MDKISVRRANVILDIDPADKEFYMNNGYSVIDKAGKVVEKAMSIDPRALRAQVADLTLKLAEAEKRIEDLTTELKNEKAERSTRTRRSRE